MDRTVVIRVLGAVRSSVGASLVIAPRFAGEVWVGPHARGGGAAVFARALGARDVALGTGILAAASSDPARAARLVQLGVIADVADAAATLVAWRHLEGPRRWITPLIAASVAAAGIAVWRTAEEVVEEEPAPASGMGEGAAMDEATMPAVVDDVAPMLV